MPDSPRCAMGSMSDQSVIPNGISVISMSRVARALIKLRRGGVEIIGGPVIHPCFLTCLDAAARRRGPADSIDALDAPDLAERAAAGIRFGGKQQPGDCRGIGSVVARLHLAHDLAAVVGFPGRAAIVFADGAAAGVQQLGFRRLQYP